MTITEYRLERWRSGLWELVMKWPGGDSKMAVYAKYQARKHAQDLNLARSNRGSGPSNFRLVKVTTEEVKVTTEEVKGWL